MSEIPTETFDELEGSNQRPSPPEGDEDVDQAAEPPADEADEGDLGAAAPMGLSRPGAKFISRFEGLVLHLYNDPVGHCSVGIGHLVHFGRCDGRASEAPFKNGITREQAFDLFRREARGFSKAVRRDIRVPLNQQQFDALVSWSFNCGVGVLKTSTLARLLNDGDYASVPAQLKRWDKAGNPPRPVAGLTRRRKAEAKLFAQGLYE